VVVQRAVRGAGGVQEVAHARARIPLAAKQLPGGGDQVVAMAIGAGHTTMIVEWIL
jgi:hypothetical protein